MNIKKLLFGSYDYNKTSENGKEKLSIKIDSGWVIGLIILGLIAWLVLK
ncbi:hypothetical protein ABPS01_00815 [Streptococcus sp. ZJ151]